MPKISLIAALSVNGVIGIANRLPWHLPADWENFHRVTKGKIFIQGRLSYQAADALHSERQDLVLSRNSSLELPAGARRIDSLEAALALVQDEEEVFVLGGASVFKQALPFASYLYLTIVHGVFDGDAFFPPIDWRKWELVRSCRHPQDDEHSHALAMNEYVCRK